MFQQSFRNNSSRFHRRPKFNHTRGNSSRRNGSGRQKQFFNSNQYVNNTIVQSKADVYEIKNKFSDFPIDKRLLENIISKGYVSPTPIQDQSIASIIQGHDLIGIAQTGTGKTAAFLIPLINKIINDRRQKVLIIVPTRELSVQISDELNSLSKFLQIYATLAIGGLSINRQISELRNNPQVIISTPGRLKDLINRRIINLNNFQNIVLDEVDRMLDIGFLPEIKYIISLLPEKRQSLFFSATITPEINGIIKSFVKNPITISVKSNDPPSMIEQNVIRVNNKDEKFTKLKSLLEQEEFTKVLIFGRTKHGVERLSKKLYQIGFSAASIHGNKTQNQRLRVLSQFKQNQLRILVATDIAARGLDIPDVSHVINFDEPGSQTDYIHRIGRTGRAQKTGKALTFVG